MLLSTLRRVNLPNGSPDTGIPTLAHFVCHHLDGCPGSTDSHGRNSPPPTTDVLRPIGMYFFGVVISVAQHSCQPEIPLGTDGAWVYGGLTSPPPVSSTTVAATTTPTSTTRTARRLLPTANQGRQSGIGAIRNAPRRTGKAKCIWILSQALSK